MCYLLGTAVEGCGGFHEDSLRKYEPNLYRNAGKVLSSLIKLGIVQQGSLNKYAGFFPNPFGSRFALTDGYVEQFKPVKPEDNK